jgi:hypothetical protein
LNNTYNIGYNINIYNMLEGPLLGLLYFTAGAFGILALCGGGFAIHYYCCERRTLNINRQSLLSNNHYYRNDNNNEIQV